MRARMRLCSQCSFCVSAAALPLLPCSARSRALPPSLLSFRFFVQINTIKAYAINETEIMVRRSSNPTYSGGWYEFIPLIDNPGPFQIMCVLRGAQV